jgi:hypothetical protein
MTETIDNTYLLEVRGDKPLQIQKDLNAAVDRAVFKGHLSGATEFS